MLKIKDYYYSLKVVLDPKSDIITDPAHPTDKKPSGKLDATHLVFCKELYDESSNRSKIVQNKAVFQFGTISVLLPLAITTTVHLTNTIDYNIVLKWISLISTLCSIILLLFSVVAAYRAITIRKYQKLSFTSLTTAQGRRIEPFNYDKICRGYAWCALYNEKANNKIADFVIASQRASIVALSIYAAGISPSLIPLMLNSTAQTIQGKINVENNADYEQLKTANENIALIGRTLDVIQQTITNIKYLDEEKKPYFPPTININVNPNQSKPRSKRAKHPKNTNKTLPRTP